MDDGGGISGKTPTDYEALEKMAENGNAVASTILANIQPKIDAHMQNFEIQLADSEFSEEQKKKLLAEERRNFSNHMALQFIREDDFLNFSKPLKDGMDSAKSDIEKERIQEREKNNKSKSAAQKELADKKAKLRGEKTETSNTNTPLSQNASQSEVLSVARKNPIISKFMDSAPVADILLAQHHADHEAFYEAIQDLDSPEGGKLVLAMLKAVCSRQGDQTTKLLLFAFDLFPEMFDKLTAEQLKDVSDIFEAEALRWNYIDQKGIAEQRAKSLSEALQDIQNSDDPRRAKGELIVTQATLLRNRSAALKSLSIADVSSVAQAASNSDKEMTDAESTLELNSTNDMQTAEDIDACLELKRATIAVVNETPLQAIVSHDGHDEQSDFYSFTAEEIEGLKTFKALADAEKPEDSSLEISPEIDVELGENSNLGTIRELS